MQLEVLERKENPLLKRVEGTFKATHKAEPTPTRDARRAFLAREVKATKDIVVIDYQVSPVGRNETVVDGQGYRRRKGPPASSGSSTRLTAIESRESGRTARSAGLACSSRDTVIARRAGVVGTPSSPRSERWFPILKIRTACCSR